jgi:hypothetical protein
MSVIHIVEQGECLSSLAKVFGLPSWRTIYEHPENAAFRKQRPNPNQIYPGDQLFIPDLDLKTVEGSTEQKHSFVVKTIPVLLRIAIKDENWRVFVGKEYRLKVDTLDKPYAGITSELNGRIEHPQPGEQKIGAEAQEAELTVWLRSDRSQAPAVWRLKLGHLDPVEERTGVQKRLANLGFPVGEPDGRLNESTQEALAAFQAMVGLRASGDDDRNTRDALMRNHDRLSTNGDSGRSAPFEKRAAAYAARLHKDSPKEELSATLSYQRTFRFSI